MTRKIIRVYIKTHANTRVDEDSFARDVLKILSDKRGWGKKFKPVRVSLRAAADYKITLASNGFIKKTCGFNKMSCTFMNRFKCYINATRWKYGSAESKLPLGEYRTYLINHEFGHMQGYRDQATCPKKGQKASVMLQHTLGLRGCKKNIWTI